MGMLAFGFGGVQMTFTSLGAVHLELRRHLPQRLDRRLVAGVQLLGAADRRVERGVHRVRLGSRQFGTQRGDLAGCDGGLLVGGLGVDCQLVVAGMCTLHFQPAAGHRQLGLGRGELVA